MKCSICKQEIDIVNGWKEGHNAQPINDGRCCIKCNETEVIPVRLQRHFERKVVKE